MKCKGQSSDFVWSLLFVLLTILINTSVVIIVVVRLYLWQRKENKKTHNKEDSKGVKEIIDIFILQSYLQRWSSDQSGKLASCCLPPPSASSHSAAHWTQTDISQPVGGAAHMLHRRQDICPRRKLEKKHRSNSSYSCHRSLQRLSLLPQVKNNDTDYTRQS